MNSGMGFIIPTIEIPFNEDLSLLESDRHISFEYYFNRELFVSRLGAACPRMEIYDDIESATNSDIEIYHFTSRAEQL